MESAALDPLIDEAVKKSGLVWVGPASGETAPAPVWLVWDGGCIYLLCGGTEQPPPGVTAGSAAIVVARSKDKWTRLISFIATTETVEESEEWERIAAVMLTKRLNLADGDEALQRWARDCTMLRLRPTGEIRESPGHYAPESHATEPVATTAGTKVPRPWHLFGRPNRKR